MRKSEINLTIELDDKNVPEKIRWNATDSPDENLSETKAMSLSLWDDSQKNTMRIDLWTKDMPVDEMKRFFVDCLGGLAQSILTSTGDEFMSQETNDLCDKLVKHLEREMKKG